LPDGYLWAKAYALEALCNLAIAERLPEATIWTDELQAIAARSGMREFSIRALMHRAALGDPSSGTAAKLLMREVDNPLLHSQIEPLTATQFYSAAVKL
jgi:hypothetical protein